jgi:hypothetical protein
MEVMTWHLELIAQNKSQIEQPIYTIRGASLGFFVIHQKKLMV